MRISDVASASSSRKSLCRPNSVEAATSNPVRMSWRGSYQRTIGSCLGWDIDSSLRDLASQAGARIVSASARLAYPPKPSDSRNNRSWVLPYRPCREFPMARLAGQLNLRVSLHFDPGFLDQLRVLRCLGF